MPFSSIYEPDHPAVCSNESSDHLGSVCSTSVIYSGSWERIRRISVNIPAASHLLTLLFVSLRDALVNLWPNPVKDNKIHASLPHTMIGDCRGLAKVSLTLRRAKLTPQKNCRLLCVEVLIYAIGISVERCSILRFVLPVCHDLRHLPLLNEGSSLKLETNSTGIRMSTIFWLWAPTSPIPRRNAFRTLAAFNKLSCDRRT